MASQDNLLRCAIILVTALISTIQGQVPSNSWPADSTNGCTQGTKQKAMYAHMNFNPSLNAKHYTKMEVITVWNNLTVNPAANQRASGVYIAYNMGIKDGPAGYLGIQLKPYEGQFLMSFWDHGRWIGTGHNKKPKKAEALAWPADTGLCRRHCLDCALAELRQWRDEGLTTGVQCLLKYPEMKAGDSYKIVMKQRKKSASLTTKKYGGMGKAHKDMLNEKDKEVKGGKWDMYAFDLQRNNKRILIGSVILEGNGDGMYYLTTFDEMLGCTKCNQVQHKDTRYGLKVEAADGTERHPTAITGLTQKSKSTCKKYSISGSKTDGSVTFEQGPFTAGDFPHQGGAYQPVW